jgi:transposase
MYWPPFSPDLNPIENLWGELSRLVYGNGKTYDNLIDLKNSITENWELISERYCKKLVDSMENRIKQVIEKDGASINY